jgi:hypothetical protein
MPGRRGGAGRAQEAFGVSLTDIGCIVEGPISRRSGVTGTEHQLEPTGWDHFR